MFKNEKYFLFLSNDIVTFDKYKNKYDKLYSEKNMRNIVVFIFNNIYVI